MPEAWKPLRILIIKLSSLGDVLHGIPVVSALRKNLPDARISWLVSNSFAPVVSMVPGVDRIYGFDREAFRRFRALPASLRRLRALIKELQTARFDVVIDLQCLLRSALFAFAAKVPVRIGLDNAREGARFFYTQAVPVAGKNLHAVDQNLAVLPYILPDAVPVTPDFTLAVPDGAAKTMRQVLRQSGVEKPYALLLPGARWASKIWPAAHFRQLASELAASRKLPVVVAGGVAEKKDWATFRAQGVTSLIGQTSLEELAALVQGAAFLVTNDSGPMHLGACFNKRVLVLMGPTRPEKTGPYNAPEILQKKLPCVPCLRRICPRRDVPMECLTTLLPGEVLARLQALQWVVPDA